jgi:hypothetical protein
VNWIPVVGLLLLAACTPTTDAATTTSADATTTSTVPTALDSTTQAGLDGLLAGVFTESFDDSHLDTIVEGGDVRAGWVLVDLLRFYQSGEPRDALVFAFTQLTGVDPDPSVVDFVWASNALISRDTPAWDGYDEVKAEMYERLDPRWSMFFDSDEAMDWRLVTWGGVLIDDRPFGDNGPCNCIPALDDPLTTDAAGGAWYDDDRIIFGVVVDEEAIALPKHQMEVHEMVNLTLGGEELGIPYCTLCGSAQAYLTGGVDEGDRVVLRTSGLLSRSNKVMYDLHTGSVFDTFTGEAKTGPLAETGVILEQVTVIVSTWGEWKEAHPNTRILAQDGGIGRSYEQDPLGGRDDDGPIFPVGDVDPRLPVQELVLGVVTPEGTAVAFPVIDTKKALNVESEISFEGVVVQMVDGIRVFDENGVELPTHQAFWFAWSQFYPDTLVWGH